MVLERDDRIPKDLLPEKEEDDNTPFMVRYGATLRQLSQYLSRLNFYDREMVDVTPSMGLPANFAVRTAGLGSGVYHIIHNKGCLWARSFDYNPPIKTLVDACNDHLKRCKY